MWPKSCNITKCFGREIRMKSLAGYRNWAKAIPQKWPRPSLNKTNKFNFFSREQWFCMNQVILFVTFYPLVGTFSRSNLKDQLNIQLSQETGCLTLLGAGVLGFGMCFDCQIPKPSIGTIVYWILTDHNNFQWIKSWIWYLNWNKCSS